MQHLFCPLSTTFFVYIYISQLAIRNCISILNFSAPSLMQHKTEPNSCTGIASSREGSYFIAFWWPTQTQIGLSITKLKEFSSSSYSLSFSASSCGLQSLDSHKTLIRSFSPPEHSTFGSNNLLTTRISTAKLGTASVSFHEWQMFKFELKLNSQSTN